MSSQVTFQDAMQTLQAMFSHVPREQIKQILLSHRGVMERAVDQLLRMPEQQPAVRGVASGHHHHHHHDHRQQQDGNVAAMIHELEQLKASAIRHERFLEAENLKNRISELRAQQERDAAAAAAAAAASASATAAAAAAAAEASSTRNAASDDGNGLVSPLSDFDDLTPLFLRQRSSRRRRLDLPEEFLRSPAFRKAAIENKILASGLALQLHDEMQQEQRQQRDRNGARSDGTSRPETSADGPRQPSKASLWFKNLGDRAKVGFQKFKESIKKPAANTAARRTSRAVTNASNVVVGDAESPSRARGESTSEYAAMDDNGEYDPFEDELEDNPDFSGGNSARNQMLWKMNRKPAASIRGFEMKDIGSPSNAAEMSEPLAASSSQRPEIDAYGHEAAAEEDARRQESQSKAATGGEYVDIAI